MKPVIGIISRPIKDELDRSTNLVFDKCRSAIIRNGGIPMGIMPTSDIDYYNTLTKYIKEMTEEEKEDIIVQINRCDGILLQGGARWFNYDKFISNYCIENNIPALHMCMSMQLLGNMDLAKKVDKVNLVKVEGHKSEEDYVHNIIIDNSSLLYEIIGKTKIMVNSRHNYALPDTNELMVSARGEDGTIEAIERKDKDFILGVQWHPEIMCAYDEDQAKILKYFINKSRR